MQSRWKFGCYWETLELLAVELVLLMPCSLRRGLSADLPADQHPFWASSPFLPSAMARGSRSQNGGLSAAVDAATYSLLHSPLPGVVPTCSTVQLSPSPVPCRFCQQDHAEVLAQQFCDQVCRTGGSSCTDNSWLHTLQGKWRRMASAVGSGGCAWLGASPLTARPVVLSSSRGACHCFPNPSC